jgi:AcrR family transcriptional regulator
MAPKPLTKPRKEASQRRSRATVDALVEATARVLVREGFDKASTNRIAEVAGVSIGSLYQYFPGKEALVAAVIDRHNCETMQLVHRALAEVASLPIDKAVRRLVAMAVEAHQVDPKLHRVLAEQIPKTGRLAEAGALNREIFALFKSYLERHSKELRMRDVSVAAFVCVTSIEAVAHTAVLHHAETISDDKIETLIDETTRLIVGYLK